MFIRKFYEADVADASGGETAVAEPVQISAAEAMAKFGSKSSEDSVAEPIDINEKKEVEKPKDEEKVENFCINIFWRKIFYLIIGRGLKKEKL